MRRLLATCHVRKVDRYLAAPSFKRTQRKKHIKPHCNTNVSPPIAQIHNQVSIGYNCTCRLRLTWGKLSSLVLQMKGFLQLALPRVSWRAHTHTQSEQSCYSRMSLVWQDMQQVLGIQLWAGQCDQIVPAGKFQPLSIPSSNSNKMVRVNPVPASMFSLHNPGRIFQEKMHLCAYKMSPLRVILSADRNISHEVSSVSSVWSTPFQRDASLWITSSAA